MNITTTKKQTNRYREQNSGYQWGRGRDNIGVEEGEVRADGYMTGSRIIQLGEYSQYLVITVNGVQPLKIVYKI